MRPGDRLANRYTLVERIGEGGMGEVWRAEQVALGRAVAIKVIHSERVHAETQANAEELRRRFQREAELAAKVEHRNVIDIIDYGSTEEGAQFLVMPFLRGATLHERLQRPPAPTLAEVLRWLNALLGGLAAIHDQGIIHRDLKPGNVFLAMDADGVVPKLLDFGISRSSGPATASLTQLGAAIGTPEYMAPEQFESARDVDERADIYGIGAILYEAVTGRPPFEGADAFAVYRAVLSTEAPRVRSLHEEVPEELAELIERAIAKAPEARWSSARAMRAAIDGLLEDEALTGIEARLSPATGAEDIGHAATTPSGEAAAGKARRVAETARMADGPTPLRVPRTVAMAAADETRDAAVEATPRDSNDPTEAPRSPPDEAGAPSVPETVMMSAEERTSVVTGSERLGRSSAGAPSGSKGATMATPAARPASSKAKVVGLGLGVLLLAAIAGFVATRPDEEASLTVAREPEDDLAEERDAAAADAHPSSVAAGIRLSEVDELDSLAISWARIPPDDRRADVRFVPAEGRWAAVVEASVPEVDTIRLASAFGSAPTPGDWDPDRGVSPRLARTRVRLNVHVDPDVHSPTARVLPHDTLVVALYGEIDGGVSAPEGEDAMTYFAASRSGGSGWSVSRYLAAFRGCLPTPDSLPHVNSLDAEGIEDDLVIARTHAWFRGRREDVLLISARDPEGWSVIAVFEALPGCGAGDELALFPIEGVLDEVFLTETTQAGGESLLVASWFPDGSPSADGVCDWAAYRFEGDTVWSDRIASAPFLTRRARGGAAGRRDRLLRRRADAAALTVRHPGEDRLFYTWDGYELVPQVEGPAEEAQVTPGENEEAAEAPEPDGESGAADSPSSANQRD